MPSVIKRLADLWLNWGRRDIAAEAAARDRVAGLRPVVVVTGGSRGIGYALAERFAEAGYEVAIIARNQPDLADAARRIGQRTGQRVTAIACDISRPEACGEIKSRLAAAGLYADILINNAGVGLAGPFPSHEPPEIDQLLQLNIVALTDFVRAFLPEMLERRRGGILNIGSLGGAAPGPHQATYYASKAYVASLTEAIASEAAGRGVRIAVVLPGPVATGFHAAMGADKSLYRQLLPELAPDAVARASYRGFIIGRRVIVPGIFNQLLYISLKLMPHGVTVPLIGWLLRRPGD